MAMHQQLAVEDVKDRDYDDYTRTCCLGTKVVNAEIMIDLVKRKPAFKLYKDQEMLNAFWML